MQTRRNDESRSFVQSHCQSFIEGCTQVLQLCMTAAGARGLQTVISIRVQPTEDLLLTTLHLSTDSLKSTKIQKKNKEKIRIQNKPSNKGRRIKRLNETKQRQHQRRHSLLEHTGVGFLYLVISGDFVVNFIPIQIKIVLQKVQFPPKFKIKSF